MAITELSSKIDRVKIYAAGATVTRIAELNLTTTQLPEQVEITGLPLALDDSSVRVWVETQQGNVPIASDLRIGLAVPPPQEIPESPLSEEIRAAKLEVQKIEEAIALINNEIEVLSLLQIPARPQSELGIAPPASPMNARLALANFTDEQIRARIQEKREQLEKLRKAQDNLADLLQKQMRASSATTVNPNSLRKTVIVSLTYEGAFSSDQKTQLVLEYFVPGARWTPTYVCRLDSASSSATIALRALISQRTGEDWSGVSLELSTANPVIWCELPELRSLRLGQAQKLPQKPGWRQPPMGANLLFEDFDKQKNKSISALPQAAVVANIRSPKVTELPNLAATLSIIKESITRIQKTYQNELGMSDEMLMDEGNVGYAAMAPSFIAEDEFVQLESLLETPRAIRARRIRVDPELERQAKMASSLASPFTNTLAYGLMRIGEADNRAKRGKLSLENRQEAYLEILKRQNIVVNFSVLEVIKKAVSEAENSQIAGLPLGGINVREYAGSFDYAYKADGRIDVPSDREFHSVALTSKGTEVDIRYIVVPREDTNVFRIAQLRNPLQAPLLPGSADIYVDGEFILSTNIATVPPKGQMELGLGVEQAIKVARNTFYREVRSSETIVAFNELRHQIKIDITNHLPKEARIEVRERLPLPKAEAKVDVQIDRVSPDWEKYQQTDRENPIRGGYHWQIKIPAKQQTTLSVDYTIKTFVDSEIMGGNRRE